jgi:hypothetical protein
LPFACIKKQLLSDVFQLGREAISDDLHVDWLALLFFLELAL